MGDISNELSVNAGSEAGVRLIADKNPGKSALLVICSVFTQQTGSELEVVSARQQNTRTPI